MYVSLKLLSTLASSLTLVFVDIVVHI